MWHKDKNNFNTICNLSDIFTKISSKRHYTIYDIYSDSRLDKNLLAPNKIVAPRKEGLERVICFFCGTIPLLFYPSFTTFASALGKLIAQEIIGCRTV